MRGHNIVTISGNVGSSIVIGKTASDGRSACSFALASQNDKRRLTWVRINAYDKLAEYCSKKLNKGIYVSVVGELMNRSGQHGELTEVRAHQVIFQNMQKADSNEYDEYGDSDNDGQDYDDEDDYECTTNPNVPNNTKNQTYARND
jgi:single-stranded DNA-binding protein